ncbi:hypothetical protein OS965_02540 [Streptomyces sp. H27-G5]|uniref:hypothetical protein n=1 Tax=Streptomyces sp. H27-G5 TaxID=2996698 RepID=UPI00226EE1CD|nr:hypothetical protein [Streptomyces sp. H27-G5]MCY0917055.1 hypothetical protein [Streptomyces sp. H27-G5]
MAADSPVPLASASDMAGGQFADLVRDYSADTLAQLMIEATRQCEGIAGRRLAPFTAVPESHRATGIDPDELSGSGSMPMDLQGTIGRSYSNALGGGDQVRHVWLNEYAARYPEMWTYSNLQVTLLRSYGGSQTAAAASLIGAENDSGHVWFSLGTFLPVGSMIRLVYDGGYSTVPADLGRACKLLAASLALGEIDPTGTQFGHDRGVLAAQAEAILCNYQHT